MNDHNDIIRQIVPHEKITECRVCGNLIDKYWMNSELISEIQEDLCSPCLNTLKASEL